MVKSLFVSASAGSGKTYRLTRQVLDLLSRQGELVVAATFTRAAAAQMEREILRRIAEGPQDPAEKLRLIMQAAKVRFSTLDALFHRLLCTEEAEPQVADETEELLIKAAARERLLSHPDLPPEAILIAARTLNLPPEALPAELDEAEALLEAWDCGVEPLAETLARHGRLAASYALLQEEVRAVAERTRGALRIHVAEPLLAPLEGLDLGRTLFSKAGIDEMRVAAADRQTPAYAVLAELYPRMRRLLAEYVLVKSRLRSSLLKSLGALSAGLVAEEKRRRGRIFFSDVPRGLIALDGRDAVERPRYGERLFELGYHRTAHLLVDEFQDTSRLQFELLRPLMEEILAVVGSDGRGERSLFLVGDWKQSIYQWREAAPCYLQASLAPALARGQLATETLVHNWRSTPLLIAFFNNLVRELFPQNPDLQEPPAGRDPYEGLSEVSVLAAPCERSDDPAYERLVEEIRRRQGELGCPWGEMVLLCRTNNQLAKAAAALAKAGIPTSGVKGRELLSLREGTALYLSLLELFTEEGSPFIGLALAALGYGRDLSGVLEGLKRALASFPQPQGFAALGASLQKLAAFFPPAVVECVWDEAERYFSLFSQADAASFLAFLPSVSPPAVVSEGEHAERLKLATIHAAKGLQFPHVFLFWKEGFDRPEALRHPADGCPLLLGSKEIEFLGKAPTDEAGQVAEAAGEARERRRQETANLLYVAATRAEKTLTIVVRADKQGALKGFGELMARAAAAPIAAAARTDCGWRFDYGPKRGTPRLWDELSPRQPQGVPFAAPAAEEMDPAFVSARIEEGMARGIRLHAALAGMGPDGSLPAGLSGEERRVLERFLAEPQVRAVVFRPGKVLAEQHLSDRSAFGIADRLIISPERITLIDYKTGRTGHLAERYKAQLERYRAILRELFAGRPVEGYILFVDEPHRILEV